MGSFIRILIALAVALSFAALAYSHGRAVGEATIEGVVGPAFYQCNQLVDKLTKEKLAREANDRELHP